MNKLLTDDELLGQNGLLSDEDMMAEAPASKPAPADAPTPDRGFADYARDIVATGLKAAIAVPETAVGLADLVTGGRAGKVAEGIGIRFKDARDIANEEISSEAQKAARKKVDAAEGFFGTAETMLQNPSTIAESVGESLGLMGAGGMVGRGIATAAPKVAPWLAAALGEGVVGAGSAAESMRQESSDGLLSAKQTAAALGSGVGTAAFGAAGNKLAGRLGVGDADTMLVRGAIGDAAGQVKPKGFLRQVAEAGLAEGVFEELPQSAQEQMWQNYGNGRPIMEGVDKAAAAGMLAGGVMGAGAGGIRAYAQNSAPPSVQDDAPAARPSGDAQATAPAVPAPAAPAAPAGDLVQPPDGEQPELFTPKSLTALDRADELERERAALDERLAELNRPDAGYGPMFDKERAELAQRVVDLQDERERITASFPPAVRGMPASFSTESGAQIQGDYALLEADDLVTSHTESLRPNPTYPSELQPRDRDRAASEAQISGIVAKLDPARLGISADAATGAPIIGADGLVESGNARTIALKRVYQARGAKAQAYRDYLKANAAQFGLAPEVIDGMQKPVLVRVRATPVDRAEFARQANTSTVAAMSASEQAKSDAARVDTMEDLQPDDNGDFSGPASRPFIRRFMARLPINEQAGMVEADGTLSQAGYARVRNAVLAKAYGDSPVLRRMVESLDDNSRNVTKALMIAAPRVAAMRDAIGQGRRFDADMTPDLMAAVQELSSLRERGTSVADALAQQGIEGDPYSPETREILGFLAENARSPRRMADFIVGAMDALDAAGDPGQGSMFGDTQPPSKLELMGASRRALNGGIAQDPQRGNAGTDAAPGVAPGGEPATAAGAVEPAAGDGTAAGLEGRLSRAEPAGSGPAGVAGRWAAFPPESGTLGVPRAKMPQIKGKDRGALVNFLAARGIASEKGELDAASLKPTQAEFSPEKVAKFMETGPIGERSVLVSSDGHVVDGHHQWMAQSLRGEKIPVIRLDAGIRDVLAAIEEFPSVKRSEGAGTDARAAAVANFKDALADLARIASRHTRAAMVPEDTPGLMPTMVKLMESAIQIVGTDLKAASRWVRDRLKADPRFKKFWNKIPPALYQKAATEALGQMGKPAQGGLFDSLDAATDAVQGDLFGAAQTVKPAPEAAMIDGRPYDMARDNFKPPAPLSFLSAEIIAEADGFVAKYFVGGQPHPMTQAERDEAEALLAPRVQAAKEAKVEYDQRIIDIARETGAVGQLIAPIKGVKRAAEKMWDDAREQSRAMSADDVKDLLRSTIVIEDYTQADAVIEAVRAKFDVLRVKNRIPDEARRKVGGYADVLINVRMPNGTIAEIQINVPQMLAAKENHGHKLFEAARSLPLADPVRAEIYDAMGGIYDAAYSAASRRKTDSSMGAQPRAGSDGIGRSSPPSSISRKNLPPGSSAYSAPENDAQNREPGGNLSGTFIDTPFGESVPRQSKNGLQGTSNGYNADAEGRQENDDGNAADGQAGAEGPEPGAVQEPGEGGRAAQVRGRSVGRNQRDDRRQGAGRAAEGQVGQAGPDGVRAPDERGEAAGQRGGARRNAGVPAGRDIPAKRGLNYRFKAEDLPTGGGWFGRARLNVEAFELVKKLQAEDRQATPEEQAKLAKFVGWGATEIANNIFGQAAERRDAAVRAYVQAKEVADTGRALTNRDPGYGTLFSHLSRKGDYMRYGADIPAAKVTAAAFGLETDQLRWGLLRQRLKDAMTADEWAAAARTTQYAHYTSEPVVRSIWSAVQSMGFKGGVALEPGVGAGIFPGLMPEDVANNTSYTGIEYDPITGAIAQQLFPDERMVVESFVDSALPKNFYDLAVGNPPFSGTKILADAEYKKFAFSLHDYFFAKTIDRVKPGGLMVFVTSRYTMDKLDDKARAYMADRADLVGAIRLPQTAFKANAGTEVVTDVLFLRKKVPGETFEHAKPWAKAVPINGADGKPLMVSGGEGKPDRPAMVNEYFAANPGMVLGTHANTGSMYADKEYTVAPLEGVSIDEAFARAAATLPANIMRTERGSAAEAAAVRDIDFNPKAKKEGNYYLSDSGALLQREGGVGVPPATIKPKDVPLVKDYVALRDALKQAHHDQLNDGPWEQSLAALQRAYKAFTAKHGPVNAFTVRERTVKTVDEDTGEEVVDEVQTRTFTTLRILQDDPDSTLVAALEEVNDDTGEIKPGKFLSDRVLERPAPTPPRTPVDSMLQVLNETGRVDMGAIAARLGISEADAEEALGATVYRDPEQGWVTADEYLSGNVRAKLDASRAAARADRRFERNVAALEAAQPAPKTASQINVDFGMNWIPGAIYAEFLRDVTGVQAEVSYSETTKKWNVRKVSGYSTARATSDWGTASRDAADLLEAGLTGRKIRVEKSVGSGKDAKRVLDEAGTAAAEEKLVKLRAEFKSWLWADPKRVDELTRVYNDKFNTHVARKFDGRHLTLPGASTTIKLFDHVKRGAWRIVQQGNTYLAHAVGSGKTFQMVASAMEQKRLGLIKKPMVVVPNHMLQQFAREWQMLYPAARLMVADEANFHTDNRRRFVSRVALSDLDAVIITHSAFKLLDLDPAFKAKMIDEQLDVLRAALDEAGGDSSEASWERGRGGNKKSPTVKRIEKMIESLEQKLQAAMTSAGKDTNVRFDELGVDMLYVDEAHEFRKLDYGTNRQIKGIQPEGSQRALDLYMKARYLEEKTPGRSLVMASGTPVTNTLAELYTVMRFMDRKTLQEKGIDDFDSWAAMFGRAKTSLEPNAAGAYEPVTRFNEFVNVPELTSMFREFADVLTSDHLAALLGDKRPKVEGGGRKMVITPQSLPYRRYKRQLAKRVEDSRAWRPSKDEPNNPDPIIKIIGDGRLAAIDMRFVSPSMPSDPNSKLNKMIDDVIAQYKATADMEFKDKESGKVEPNKGAAMMVFSDLGFGEGVAANRGFNARAWFEKRLRDAGIPPSHVAFMSDFKQSSAKLKLFKDVNSGRVRILVGSSKNMGTGVNAQQRLKALFHLDSPWFPADLEQREGRIIRQGNKNPLVRIFAYAAKGSYDEQMWSTLAKKQYFIDQALSGDPNVREIEDLSAVSSLEQASAMVAEDPMVMQIAGKKADAEKLERLQQAHEEERLRFRSQYDSAAATIQAVESKLADAEKRAAAVVDMAGDKFRAKAGAKTYAERTDWGQALLGTMQDVLAHVKEGTTPAGTISGFKVWVEGRKVPGGFAAELLMESGSGGQAVTLSLDPNASPVGVAMRAQNALADIARQPERMRQRAAEARALMDSLETRLQAPFTMAGMLANLRAEIRELEVELADRTKPKAWWVYRKDTGQGFEVQAPDAEEAIERAIETNGGDYFEWAARLTAQPDPMADLDAETATGAAAAGMIPPIFLSRGAGAPADRVPVAALQSLADRVKRRLPGMSAVRVLASPADLPADHKLRQFIEQRGAMGDAEGAMHDGTLYLFASGLSDLTRAEHVLAEHEAAHLGLRAILGGELPRVLRVLAAQNGALRAAANRLRAANKGMSIEEAIEEVLVDMPAGVMTGLKGWRKLVKAVEMALRAAGLDRLADRLANFLQGSVTEQARADMLAASLVREARGSLKRRPLPGRAGPAPARLSTKLSDDLAKQDAWLTREAKARGFKGIEDMLERDYAMFEKLAKLWRDKLVTGYEVDPDAGAAGRATAATTTPAASRTRDGQGAGSADSLPRLSRAPQPGAQAPLKDRVDAILSNAAGKAAPLDRLAKAVTRMTGIDRAASKVYDRGAYLIDRLTPEKVKAGVVSDYGIPEAVIDQRAMMQGRQRVQLRQAGALIEKLSTLTRAESRVAYEWMNMDGSDPRAYVSMMQGLPEESVKVLQDVQQMIDRLSREAVRLGQLDPQAYERHKFAYLRRSYAKHVLDVPEAEQKKRSRVIGILGEQYKGRGFTVDAAMEQMRKDAPEWWGRKLQAGKADKALVGQKFLRLELKANTGAGTKPLPGMAGRPEGKTRRVVYWPADLAVPQQYADFDRREVFEVRDVKGPQVVLWRDYTKDERERMGEIDEARFAIAKTLHGMIQDIEVGRYLEWLSNTQAKVDGDAIPGAHRIAEGSESYRHVYAADEWVKVPDSKIPGTGVRKYGKLAGRYLPGPIWNDVRQVVGADFRPLGETYDQVLRLWKTAKTALSPAVHMNNVMSNFVMADWHDVSAAHVGKALRLILAASKRENAGALNRGANLLARAGVADKEAAREILNRYADSGGDIGGWVTAEIAGDQMEPLLRQLEAELTASGGQSAGAQVGVFSALQHAARLRFPEAFAALKESKLTKAAGREAQALIDLYQAEDDVFRLAAWLKAKEAGATDMDAGKAARISFLDYRINAPWVQAMRKTAWPFISFTYRAVPMLLHTFGKKPHKVLKLMAVLGLLEALGQAAAGGGDDGDDGEDERKLLPEEKAGRIWGMVPKLIRMPWNDQHGSPVYLDIRRYIPVGDVLDVGAGQAAVPVLPGLMPGGPLVIFGEVLFNKSAFTGKPITLETDTPEETASKVFDHLYKAMMPNVLGLPGTYATTGVMGSMTGRTDAFGRELSTAQALSNAFGVKLGSYPADVLKRNLLAKYGAESSEIDRQIWALRRQYQTGQLDAEEFRSQVKAQQAKKAKLANELREKLAPAE